MKKYRKCSFFLILFMVVFMAAAFFFTAILSSPRSLSDYTGGTILRDTAISQLNQRNGEKYWSFCGHNSSVPWCACFVSWCASMCFDGVPVFSTCGEYLDWFKSRRCLYDNDTVPLPGMAIFFDWNGDSMPDHMGITDTISAAAVHTVEGNISGRCGRGVYDLKSSDILCYGAFVTG